MTLIDELLKTLLDGRVLTVQVGLYWTAVVVEAAGEVRCGLSATLGDDSHHYTNVPSIAEAGRLTDLPARELAGLARSNRLPETSIGMAAMNALLPPLPGGWKELHGEEVIARFGVNRKVALIGHFPFVDHLRPRVGCLWVLEQKPREGDLPASLEPEYIPQADVLAITAATLVNHTFEQVMALRHPDALVLLLGATTPLSPLLFKHGVSIISGSRVEDVESVVRAVAQGANFHQLRRMGVRLISLAAPGLDLETG